MITQSALVTGGAGFIGSHLVDRLMDEGWAVTVVDNFDPYYGPAQKRVNIAAHADSDRYRLVEADIRDAEALDAQLDATYDVIVHLAAKAGVRPSIENPADCQAVNVGGTQNLLEFARQRGVPQFVFASSSSVYGTNPDVPWSEEDNVLQPISPYASTKVSGEMMGHVYSHLYDLRFVATRLFTVYGPRQRPDLAMHKFATLMMQKEPIPVYGDGSTRRDYTYVGDIVDGLRAAMEYDDTCYQIVNLGSGQPITLATMIDTLEQVLGIEAERHHLPEQPGDVPQTWADVQRADKMLDCTPCTSLSDGLSQLVDWLQVTEYARNGQTDNEEAHSNISRRI
jgi:UDP-glucuronate 4-epimerase